MSTDGIVLLLVSILGVLVCQLLKGADLSVYNEDIEEDEQW